MYLTTFLHNGIRREAVYNCELSAQHRCTYHLHLGGARSGMSGSPPRRGLLVFLASPLRFLFFAGRPRGARVSEA
jgi:hypothetical protein